jgi:hypothetical protein
MNLRIANLELAVKDEDGDLVADLHILNRWKN